MRIVLDTNVLVSSLWGGPPKGVLDACRAGRVRLLLSLPILDEYLAVLGRFDLPDEDADLFGSLFADPDRTELCAPAIRIRAVPDDPADDKFIECAVAGKADRIVSGDRHLLKLRTFRGIPILKPRKLLDELAAS